MTRLSMEELPPHLQAEARRQIEAHRARTAGHHGPQKTATVLGVPRSWSLGWEGEWPGLRLARGGNDREHHMVRAKRVKAEREAIHRILPPQQVKLPADVVITRVSPHHIGLDKGNLAGSCKAVEDEVAAWLGVDDNPNSPAQFFYRQERGEWAVKVRVSHVDPYCPECCQPQAICSCAGGGCS